MDMKVKQSLMLVAIALLVSAATPVGTSSQIKLPGSPPPDDPASPESIAETLRRFRCTCSIRPEGWKCEQLSGFPFNSWSHRDMDAFAARVLILSRRLPEQRFVIGLQGIADSRRIENGKLWTTVPSGRCRRRQEGTISNDDLAQLRACMVGRAIMQHSGNTAKIEYLTAIAYKPEDRKYLDVHRAAVVYLLGRNGGCR